MNIFVNNRLVKVINDKYAKELAYSEYYDKVFDIRLSPLKIEKIIGHSLLLNIDKKTIDKLLAALHKEETPEFQSVTITTKDKEAIELYIESLYTVIKAAGGIVEKEGQILLIHRLGKWDLPKGKLDKGEKSKIAAVREVEEECMVKAILEDKICTTWHTYTMAEKKYLKRTKWYKMKLIDDSKMKPQQEEGIDKLEWMSQKKVENAMINSYSSIRFVISQYYGQE